MASTPPPPASVVRKKFNETNVDELITPLSTSGDYSAANKRLEQYLLLCNLGEGRVPPSRYKNEVLGSEPNHPKIKKFEEERVHILNNIQEGPPRERPVFLRLCALNA
jgi:hypothetical protein